MKNEKTKAAVLIALGLTGMTLAYAAGLLANSEEFINHVQPAAGPEARRETQNLLLQFVIFGLGGGCLLTVWGASRWGRADENERQAREQRQRKGVAA